MPSPAKVDAAAAPLLAAFRRAAADMPWFRTLLAESGVDAAGIVDLPSFVQHSPILTKHNTFDRFPVDQLAATTPIHELAGVLTSSGHGGRFSFGLTTRGDAALGPSFIDRSLDAAFSVRSRKTLVVNCLPMGVGFGSACMTVATTSVREDMALALVDTFGRHYDQIVLVGDPLFMKRLTDFAAARAFDWTRHRLGVVLGEEVFGEHYRTYLAACLGLDADRPDGGYIMSSFGVGELGLHLGYETPAAIVLRRAAWRRDDVAAEVLGRAANGSSVPALLAFDPRRTFVEVLDPGDDGYGHLTLSMLDPEMPIPLLRYQTGDLAQLVDADHAAAVCRRHGIALPGGLPSPLLALRGRLKEQVPGGSDAGHYKDALYADPEAATALSGAFRIALDNGRRVLHIQRALTPGAGRSLDDAELSARIQNALHPAAAPDTITIWPHATFPFGMGLDYERKFTYL